MSLKLIQDKVIDNKNTDKTKQKLKNTEYSKKGTIKDSIMVKARQNSFPVGYSAVCILIVFVFFFLTFLYH